MWKAPSELINKVGTSVQTPTQNFKLKLRQGIKTCLCCHPWWCTGIQNYYYFWHANSFAYSIGALTCMMVVSNQVDSIPELTTKAERMKGVVSVKDCYICCIPIALFFPNFCTQFVGWQNESKKYKGIVKTLNWNRKVSRHYNILFFNHLICAMLNCTIDRFSHQHYLFIHKLHSLIMWRWWSLMSTRTMSCSSGMQLNLVFALPRDTPERYSKVITSFTLSSTFLFHNYMHANS